MNGSGLFSHTLQPFLASQQRQTDCVRAAGVTSGDLSGSPAPPLIHRQPIRAQQIQNLTRSI